MPYVRYLPRAALAPTPSGFAAQEITHAEHGNHTHGGSRGHAGIAHDDHLHHPHEDYVDDHGPIATVSARLHRLLRVDPAVLDLS